MVDAFTTSRLGLGPRVGSWLAKPLSGRACMVGWVLATALFVGIVALLGGPSRVDAPESVYGTWAIAHGRLACAYPPVSPPGYPPAAPLYLLLSGAIAGIAHIGHAVPFPPAYSLGANCGHAISALQRWSAFSGALDPTLWVGCVAWLALMAGAIAWLRASGRGRCGWEPVTVVILACLPPVWMCVQSTFHPQDLLAIGLALSAMTCARRGRWIGAGVLAALAVLSQQFALLVALPLLLLAPVPRRISYAGAALTTAVLVDAPLLLATSGHALRAITLGTGDNPAIGGTVLWELHLSGAGIVLLSRVAPIALSAALAWWVSRRVGSLALDPAILMSVVAVSLSLRLVFEQNLFGYYFMALSVCLILLDVVGGHIRSSLVAWLAAVVLVFCVFHGLALNYVVWGARVRSVLPLVVVVPALCLILVRTFSSGGRSIRSLLPWFAVGACAILTWPIRSDPFSSEFVRWLWQIALVVPGIVLASGPLLAGVRTSATKPSSPVVEGHPGSAR